MKYITSTLQKEGFDAILRITFENGLVLSTENFLWSGKKRQEEIIQQFSEFLSLLETPCSKES